MKLLARPWRPWPLRIALTGVALLALAAAMVAPVLIRAGTTPAPAPAAWELAGQGADAYQVSDLQWVDAGRGRPVPVRLFWPASAQHGKVPLIVFSHGIGSARDGYGYLGRYWASRGVASLHLQHVGSDRALWRGDWLSLVSRFQHAAGDAEAIARAQDFHFALDRLLQSERGAYIDRARITAAGHSYGANTTLLVAGAQVLREGRMLQFRDPRVSSAIVISAPPFYGESDFAPILSGIRIPTLHVTTDEDVIRIPGFGSGVEDRRRVFEAIGGPKVLAVYRHGSHNVFTEKRYFDSLQVATEVKAATESLSLAFLDQAYGQGDALQAWSRAHAVLYSEYRREL